MMLYARRMCRLFRPLMLALVSGMLLSACEELPDWMGGAPPVIKRAPGERVDLVMHADALKADAEFAEVPIEIPEQTNLEQWQNTNDAMIFGHVGLTGVMKEQSAAVGDGNGFARNVVASPIVVGGMVYAMDAAGVVSAHDEADISTVKWVDDTDRNKHVSDVLGGGIAAANGVIYATTGLGGLRALDAISGAVKWHIKVGAPVRGAPAISGEFVVVLTADNQTLAYDVATGQPRWEHRGIRETTGYFSVTSPVISDGIVVSAYSSGEVFALRLETGSVLWSDTLAGNNLTKASATVGGIDADPIVQDGVVVIASAGGQMQASALLNGRPLWQANIGTHMIPWSAGNVLFVLSSTNDVAAVFKRNGAVRWATSLAVNDSRDPTQDKTPPLYGPILSANAVLVIDGNGVMSSFKPLTGELIGSYALEGGIVTAPVIANGALYLITKSGKLLKYY